MDRRSFVGATLALGLTGLPLGASAQTLLERIQDRAKGRLGIAAIDTRNGNRLLLAADQRFPLCSTFKLPLAAAVLWRADRGELSLDDSLRITEADLLDWAPGVKANLARGEMTLAELCRAAIVQSDNAAANLLLPQIGGPAGLTRFVAREAGDTVTRFDRPEPLLNQVARDDPRDTTTPLAMAGLMDSLLLGSLLSASARERLIGWMVASETGKARLRAGLPRDWRAGDKTGSCAEGIANDVAIAFPPERKPVLIAAYLDSPGLAGAQADAVHAEIGRLVGLLFG